MKTETYFDIVWRQFRKNYFAYAALFLLLPLFLIGVFAPMIASNVPFYFHDARQTLVADTAEATIVYHDIGAGEATTVEQKLADLDEARNAADTPAPAAAVDAEAAETVEVPDPNKKLREWLSDGLTPWFYDSPSKTLYLRSATELRAFPNAPMALTLDGDASAPTSLIALVEVDREPQRPESAARIDLFTTPATTLLVRHQAKTFVYRQVPAPKIEKLPAEKSVEPSPPADTQPEPAVLSVAGIDGSEPAESEPSAPSVFLEGNQVRCLVSIGEDRYKLTYADLPEPAVVSAGETLSFIRTTTAFPWFRALVNPKAAVDWLFNAILILFFPWLILALILNHFWRRAGTGGRIRALRATWLLIGMTSCGLGLFLLTKLVAPGILPTDRYQNVTFPTAEFRSGGMKWAIYPPIPFGPGETDLSSTNKPPGYYQRNVEEVSETNDDVRHILGTSREGEDVLAQMLYGTRISLTVGFVAVGLYLTIGIIVGAVAGFFGGWVDIVICRVIEIMMLFPALFLVMTIVALLGKSIYIVMIVIGITGWPGIARLIRGEVLKQRQIEYVTAARALGGSNLRIIFRHVLPNSLSPAMVAAPFGIAGAIITEAGLSLLGFGAEPSEPTWGNLLNQAKENYNNWWLIIFPAIAIFITVTLLNLVGNGLRDAMDPRLRR